MYIILKMPVKSMILIYENKNIVIEIKSPRDVIVVLLTSSEIWARERKVLGWDFLLSELLLIIRNK